MQRQDETESDRCRVMCGGRSPGLGGDAGRGPAQWRATAPAWRIAAKKHWSSPAHSSPRSRCLDIGLPDMNGFELAGLFQGRPGLAAHPLDRAERLRPAERCGRLQTRRVRAPSDQAGRNRESCCPFWPGWRSEQPVRCSRYPSAFPTSINGTSAANGVSRAPNATAAATRPATGPVCSALRGA